MPAPKRIVVVGGGFAGAYCAQELERRLKPAEAEVLLIDRQNYFVFYPLLIEAGTGNVEPRHAVVSIRSFLRRAAFRMAEVTGLDPATRELLCLGADGRPHRVGYDHLVIALGSVTRMPPVPGLREHGFQIKTLGDAITLRDRAIHLLEVAEATDDPQVRAASLRFVVVGANFTGAEIAGELDAVFRSAIREYPSLKLGEVRITLIDRGDRILSALDGALSEYAARRLTERGIDIRLRESVEEISAGSVRLTSGATLATRTVIWAAGIAPPPVVACMPLPLDGNGYIVCERDLRVRGHADIWGIGDCAVNTDAEGRAYPATAQHAVREGRACARNIARALRGRPTLPCDIRAQGSLAALGCRTGVAQVFGVNVSGFAAWWLWRTVYLLKMPGLARKLRVALDWTVQLFFRREYVQLGAHGEERDACIAPPADASDADRPAGPRPAAAPERWRAGLSRR
ncbi:MAG: NAD(P)/FAD-dependent oxidoreductase [Phycisphaerales bacterium]